MNHRERLTAKTAALMVIDVQERLIAAINDRERILANAIRLVRIAEILGIRTIATEQYPQGLGPTVEPLARLIPHRRSKMSFHALGALGVETDLISEGIRHVTVVGLEAHVCVAQTALELLHLGYAVQVPADAVGSRFAIDHEYALRRLEQAGAVVTTAESAIFEWLESADHPNFKEVSALVKERPGV